jgi:hypothetical protein
MPLLSMWPREAMRRGVSDSESQKKKNHDDHDNRYARRPDEAFKGLFLCGNIHAAVLVRRHVPVSPRMRVS